MIDRINLSFQWWQWSLLVAGLGSLASGIFLNWLRNETRAMSLDWSKAKLVTIDLVCFVIWLILALVALSTGMALGLVLK